MLSDQTPRTPALSPRLIDDLAASLADHAQGGSMTDIRSALDAVCTEAHHRKLPPEAIVLALKTAWGRVLPPRGTSHAQWSEAYYSALSQCLSVYFDETG